ncbi:MAG: phosphoribosyl-AMP cyclohydrolase [Nanoarchaeota archaeon]|nr:phosphoribosyl-AMP cyclohydrolase [Nanoarchaeota archaeon]
MRKKIETTSMLCLGFGKDGLIPTVVQDKETKEVLMLVYLDREEFIIGSNKGLVTFYNKDKSGFWLTGDGENIENPDIKDILVNCYQDSLLLQVYDLECRPYPPFRDRKSRNTLYEGNLLNGGISNLSFDDEGVVPVIVQDIDGDVLMLAYANQEAIGISMKSKLATFWSRSRQKLWIKGAEESGNFLDVEGTLSDGNSVIYNIGPLVGGACHVKNNEWNNFRSCFYRKLSDDRKSLEYIL